MLVKRTNEIFDNPLQLQRAISAIHKGCLERWLHEKYSQSFTMLHKKAKDGPTGLHCELCKCEYVGKFKLGSISYILRSLKESKLISSILLNVVVMAAVTYKLSKSIEKVPGVYQALKQSLGRQGLQTIGAVFHSVRLLSNVSAISFYCFVNTLLISFTGKMFITVLNKLYRLEIANH